MFKIKNTHHHQKDCLEYILHDILKKCSGKPLELFFSNATIRKHIMRLADKKIRANLLQNKKFPQKVQKDKYYMGRAAMSAINKAFEKANNAPNVRRAVVNALALEVFLKRKRKLHVEKYKKQHGFGPPLFLTIAANKLCNLKCVGCYANSSSANSEKLSWDVLNRIIKEKTNLWGSYFTAITGGEPLLYQDQGKTIIDLAKEHQDNYFLMYTNGTLITK
ncbi:radical SAM protein, partial [Candidatus Parcubacteria bacterium]|nr:radical SAM protein [Candidatus Parcubacteria bacterium]